MPVMTIGSRESRCCDVLIRTTTRIYFEMRACTRKKISSASLEHESVHARVPDLLYRNNRVDDFKGSTRRTPIGRGNIKLGPTRAQV